MMSSIVEQRQKEDMTNTQTPWNRLFGVDEALHRSIGNVNCGLLKQNRNWSSGLPLSKSVF